MNRVETRLPRTLDIAKRAGQLYSSYLRKRGEGVRRILPDFLIGAHAEVYASQLVTWNPEDFRNYLSIEVRTPGEVIKAPEKSPKKATDLSSSRLSAKNRFAKILTPEGAKEVPWKMPEGPSL